MSRSHELPLASCKRVLLAGAPKGVSRMGEDATKECRQQLELLVKRLGKDCAEMLVLTKRKTVNVDMLSVVVSKMHGCKGITSADLSHHVRKGKGMRGLPEAAVKRLFKKALGGSSRVTDEAVSALVGASEAYLRHLGHVSATLAGAAKRQTIQAADVSAAARL